MYNNSLSPLAISYKMNQFISLYCRFQIKSPGNEPNLIYYKFTYVNYKSKNNYTKYDT